MKKITQLSAIVLMAFSCSAVAQSGASEGPVAQSQKALAAISEVSGVGSSDFLRWEKGLVYKVQILSSDKPLSNVDARLNGLRNVYQSDYNGATIYTWGRTRLAHEAARLQGEMHRNGFKDAFVVHFYNGKRIPLEEALKLRATNSEK